MILLYVLVINSLFFGYLMYHLQINNPDLHLSPGELLYFNMEQVQATKVKRLCKTHNSITVNGMFPGPTLEVKNGDSLVVKVVNKARYNVTIHW